MVPGQGIEAMRPVRVTSAGSSPTLPLRMVAAGTGAVTPITLWVMGEGLYEPTNFASFLIGAEDLTWNWDTQSSDFSDLRGQRFADAGGAAWHLEAGEPFSSYSVEDQLTYLVDYDTENSGYGGDEQSPTVELNEDMAALFGQLDRTNLGLAALRRCRAARSPSTCRWAPPARRRPSTASCSTKEKGTPPACPTFPRATTSSTATATASASARQRGGSAPELGAAVVSRRPRGPPAQRRAWPRGDPGRRGDGARRRSRNR